MPSHLPATPPETAAAAQAFVGVQSAIAGMLPAQTRQAWPLLDVHSIRQTLPQLAVAIRAIVSRFGPAAAAAAASHYLAQRQAAGVPGRVAVRLAPQPTPQAVQAAVEGAVTGLFGTVTPQSEQAALDALTAEAEKLVLDQGRATTLGAVAADRAAKGWARVPNPGACAFCLMLATRGAVYKSAAAAGRRDATTKWADAKGYTNAFHPNCVVAGTVVNGPSVEVAYRRRYEGEVVIIRVADGQQLTITPNHPVLTPQGWVEAGRLREGDDVIQRAGADLATLDVPHEDDVPARIEQVWGAHAVTGFRTVPVAAEDFHSDGGLGNGDVDVVRADRLLVSVGESVLAQALTHPHLAGAHTLTAGEPFTTDGPLGLLLDAHAGAAHRCMSGCGEGMALLGRQLAHAERVGFGAAPDRDVCLLEPGAYGGAGDSELGGDRLLGHPGRVQGNDILRQAEPFLRGTLGPGSRFDPMPLEGEADTFGISAQLGRALLERLTGGVQVCQVVEVRRREMSGHVFNLQTVEGWYEANGLIVSNCRCAVEPLFSGRYEPTAAVRQAQALWKSSTKGKSGPEALKAFRQAVEGR